MAYSTRARNIGNKIMGGYKSTAIAAGTGVAVGIVAGTLSENVPWFQKYWYSLPLAIGLGGHILKQTASAEAGCAAVGAAGTMAYYNWRLHKASVAASGGETKGLQDTGAADDYVAALRSLPDVGGLQAPMSHSLTQMKVAG